MNQLANTGSLIRLVLRRDRIVLAIWIVFAALPPLGVAAGFAKLYPTADALRVFADECMSNPAIVAILGPVYAPTLGGMVAWRVGAMGMLATAIPSLLLIVRHTRSEDESGRLELIAATAVGRLANDAIYVNDDGVEHWLVWGREAHLRGYSASAFWERVDAAVDLKIESWHQESSRATGVSEFSVSDAATPPVVGRAMVVLRRR